MKTTDKPTEAQDAISLIKMELEGFKTHTEQAEYIIKQCPAIKRAFTSRHKERSDEIEAAIRKPQKDAPIDEMIKANEDMKTRHYEKDVRGNAIDRLERQIAIGKTFQWESALLSVFNDMDSLINGEIYSA